MHPYEVHFFCPFWGNRTVFQQKRYMKEVTTLKNKPVTQTTQKPEMSLLQWFRHTIPKLTYGISVFALMFMLFTQPAHAANVNIWTKASDIMKDVYNQIVLISTVAAIVTASIALLMMNFSRSGRTVDESRAWLKRICITWAIINGLGFIMAYITPFFAGGQWTP